MLLDNPPSKANEPIFLENTSITHVENLRLTVPCSVNVLLHLSPIITCRMEFEDFPKLLLERYQHRPFLITLRNGFKIKVLLFYNFNDLVFSKSKDSFKGFLMPSVNPCTVAQPDTRIQSVSFSLLNFREFYGSHDKKSKVNEKSLRRLGATKMEHGPWRIDITETPTFHENRKVLEQEDGYAVSHTGLIKRSDRETFLVSEAENVLSGLRVFLSFVSGSACGLTLVKATDEYNRGLTLEWGTAHVEPWNQGTRGCLPAIGGGDSISQLFPGFWCFYNNPDWKNTLCTVIDWYFNSNNSFAHIGIILAQAALESLSYKIIRKELSANKTKKLSAEEKLRKLLGIVEIDNEIPSSCTGLKNFSKRKIEQRREKSGDCYIGDAPEAIVQIRNDLVHAEKKYTPIPPEAQIDAIRLSLWYIELILLRKFGYSGQYRNRLRIAGEDSYEYVPWVKQISGQ